jgi:REP element-mobilizing transposase RayT
LAQECITQLETSSSRRGFQLVAYCLMPNHLHILTSGGESSNLVRFMQHFKQATGHRWPGLWQRSYYEHVVRSEERIDDLIGYIWSNPVAAGIVESAEEYLYSGPRQDLLGGSEGNVEDRAKALSLRSLAMRTVR